MTTPIIHPGVSLGENVNLGEYVIIGHPPRGNGIGELETIIGSGAEIRSHTVIYAGNHIGNNFQTGHRVTLRENNTIGNNVSIGTGSVVEHHVSIAEGCRLHSQTFVPEYCILEEEVWIGPNVVLTNARYPSAPDTKDHLAGIVLRKRAKIGANATILPGLTIGENALVGAGSVVTGDVAAGAVMVGNPARQVNSIKNISHYSL